jgi:hypothetical protein
MAAISFGMISVFGVAQRDLLAAAAWPLFSSFQLPSCETGLI